MYVGNIVTDTPINDGDFRVCLSMDVIDETLPTLIVGWKTVRGIYGNDVSILHKKINERTYWTFNRRERKIDFEKDLESFKEFCINSFGENIPYVYLDLLYGKKRINYRIIKKLLSLKNTTTYIDVNGMVYIYSDKIIFGIDLNVLEFFEGKKEKVINKLKNVKNNVFVDNEIFNSNGSLIIKVKNKKRLIPYISNILNNG